MISDFNITRISNYTK